MIVGSVETVARDLAELADEVRVHFPWGSLLRGMIGQDDAVLAAVARLPKRGGSVTALLSVTPRDGVAAEPVDPIRLSSLWSAHDLHVRSIRPLRKADVDDAVSSWGKRLMAGRQRSGLYIRTVRSLR